MKKILLLMITLTACSNNAIKPIDKNATPETKALYNTLHSIAEKGIMFGSQDATVYGLNPDKSIWWYEAGRSNVKDVTGDYPAVYGWELGHLEHGRAVSLDSVSFDSIRVEIIRAFERNGIITISWHNDNPLTGGSTWDTSSNQVVASILPGGEKHSLYLQWLDRLADFALSLKTDDGTYVPVLFRPYHEHTGSWFWWGAQLCTVEEYKALWKMTVDYLKNERGVHHFLYTYSPNTGFQNTEEYLERYPGDDYVDILGLDIYKRAIGQNYQESLQNGLDILSEIAAEKNKPATLSETGFNNIPEPRWWTDELLATVKNYKLLYVLVWRNGFTHEYYAPFNGAPSEANFKEFYDDPHTLFQKDIADWEIYY